MKRIHYYIEILLVLLTLLTGFYLRIVSVRQMENAPMTKDDKDYVRYAFNLRNHGIYSKDAGKDRADIRPDALRTPGYPLFLCLFVGTDAETDFVKRVQLAQVVLGTLTIGLVYFFFRNMLGPLPSLAVSLLMAISPHLVVANSYLLTEPFFTLIFVCMGVVFRKYSKEGRLRWAFLTGICMGMGGLIRPNIVFFPIIAALLIFEMGKERRRIYAMALMLAGYGMIVAPWIIRNIETLGVVSDDTLQINFLHHGMYPDFIYQGRPETYGFPHRFDPRAPEISQSKKTVIAEIARRFREEPSMHVKWFLLIKPLVFWSWSYVQGGDVFIYRTETSPYFTSPVFKFTHRFMKAFHSRLVMAALIGCLLVWIPFANRNLSDETVLCFRFISLLLIYYTLFHMIGAPFPRYAVPLRPYMYGMAVYGLSRLIYMLMDIMGSEKEESTPL